MGFETAVLLDGLTFSEGPRWHNGKLWFSDLFTHRVMTVDLDGNAETIVEVPGMPSGLGWLPGGRLLVVSMTDRRLLRLDPDGLVEVADLSALASFHCNDMVVDWQGRAYIGHFGYDYFAEASPALASIILVTPDRSARVVADGMVFPNGSVITPDGRVLIVGETFAGRLTAFDIAEDGSLTRRRTWAQFDALGPWVQNEGRVTPDGICLDAEGAVWVASFGTSEVLRVREGGQVTHRIGVGPVPVACMLGGPDRRTLFVLITEPPEEPSLDEAEPWAGRIETAEVDVPGAGLP